MKGEKFPDLLDPATYFHRHVLKNVDSMAAEEKVNYSMSYTAHKRLHEKLGIFINKVLHQGRGQCQRELDELGVQVCLRRREEVDTHDGHGGRVGGSRAGQWRRGLGRWGIRPELPADQSGRSVRAVGVMLLCLSVCPSVRRLFVRLSVCPSVRLVGKELYTGSVWPDP